MEVKYANETRLIPCVVPKGGGLNGGLAHPLGRVERVKNLDLSSIMLIMVQFGCGINRSRRNLPPCCPPQPRMPPMQI